MDLIRNINLSGAVKKMRFAESSSSLTYFLLEENTSMYCALKDAERLKATIRCKASTNESGSELMDMKIDMTDRVKRN